MIAVVSITLEFGKSMAIDFIDEMPVIILELKNKSVGGSTTTGTLKPINELEFVSVDVGDGEDVNDDDGDALLERDDDILDDDDALALAL